MRGKHGSGICYHVIGHKLFSDMFLIFSRHNESVYIFSLVWLQTAKKCVAFCHKSVIGVRCFVVSRHGKEGIICSLVLLIRHSMFLRMIKVIWSSILKQTRKKSLRKYFLGVLQHTTAQTASMVRPCSSMYLYFPLFIL